MIWIKLVDNFKFLSNGGSTREYRTTVQAFGLKVRDVVYAIDVLDYSGSNAKIGIRHDQGASDNVNLMLDQVTAITLAAATPPSVVKGVVGEATSTVLLPFFMPVVLMGSDGGQQSITANIYVGGTPL